MNVVATWAIAFDYYHVIVNLFDDDRLLGTKTFEIEGATRDLVEEYFINRRVVEKGTEFVHQGNTPERL